ncbi:MAG: response regulator, partial [Nitrospira sp.]|nr:response regulator [Nitrospira sp.]
ALLPNQPAAVPVSSSGGPATQPIYESVLIVDDDPLVCDLLVQFLRLRGYRVVGVNDGIDALNFVDDTPPDVILLDLIMPGMSGVEALRMLREKEYQGGIILMTGSHNEELLEEAWALSPQEVLVKPIDLDRLLTTIQLVLVCREC